MKKSILRVGIMGFAVAVAFLFTWCENVASPNNGGLVDGFLVRVNEKPGNNPGTGGGNVYQVTVVSNGLGATGGGANVVGAIVWINAGTLPNPRRFERWTTSSKGITFSNDTSASTSFIMPASDVTVTAVFWDYGTIADERDTKKYKTTTIGGKTWMAEDLNHKPSGGNSDSVCIGINSTVRCINYGRRYDLETAKTVCFAGWHLPTNEDWNDLVTAAGGSEVAGKRLKSADGWSRGWYETGNGTDNYGFSALPNDECPGECGFFGHWWTATGSVRFMASNYDYVGEENAWGSSGYSVRCVKD